MQARIVEVFVELDELKARVRPMSTEIDVVNPVTGGCMTVTVQVPYQEDEDAMAKALDDAIRAAYKQWGEWKGQ